VQINMRLNLPTDEASIPAVRHICAQALTEIATLPDCIHDIEVALTEACANVVEHSGVTPTTRWR
jgi:serine/threonine-protein kinase RsbW